MTCLQTNRCTSCVDPLFWADPVSGGGCIVPKTDCAQDPDPTKRWFNNTNNGCEVTATCDLATEWYNIETNMCDAIAGPCNATEWYNNSTNMCDMKAVCDNTT